MMHPKQAFLVRGTGVLPTRRGHTERGPSVGIALARHEARDDRIVGWHKRKRRLHFQLETALNSWRISRLLEVRACEGKGMEVARKTCTRKSRAFEGICRLKSIKL